MKSKLLIFVFFVFAINAIAQSTSKSTATPDPRLYEAFGKETVDFLSTNNPDMISYYNFFLDNAFTLVKHDAGKIPSLIKQYPKLELIDPKLTSDKPEMEKGTKSINILKYAYSVSSDESSTYRLDESGIVIVFYSTKEITEKYNKYKSF